MAFHQAIARFKILDFTTTRKEVEGSEKASPHNHNLIWQIAVWSPTTCCKKICMTLLFKGTDVHCITVSGHLVYGFNLKIFKPAKNIG